MESDYMPWLKPLKRLDHNRRGQAPTEMIIGGLVALILLYALASTIVTQSENAALEVEAGAGSTTSAPLFRLGPLFWALIGIGVAAAIVIKSIKS